MAVRQLDLALTDVGNHRAPAFGAGTSVTRVVKVSFLNTLTRDQLRKLLIFGREVLALRLVSEGEAPNT